MRLTKFDDADLLSVAGPAVLRLKLLEVTTILQKRNLPDDIRDAALFAVAELRQLIAERPCVSLVDIAAKKKVLEKTTDFSAAPPSSWSPAA